MTWLTNFLSHLEKINQVLANSIELAKFDQNSGSLYYSLKLLKNNKKVQCGRIAQLVFKIIKNVYKEKRGQLNKRTKSWKPINLARILE